MDYSKDVNLDPNALDVEWLVQPRLMSEYTQTAAELRKRMDIAKEKVDFVKAELGKAIRTDPDAFGVAKVTETAIQDTIILHDKYQAALADYIEAKFQFEVARGAVESISQRKDSLESLVKLHGQSYFAGPSVPRDLSAEAARRNQQNESDAATAQAMRLRRRNRNGESR